MQAGISQSKTEKQATRRGRAIYNTYTHLNMKGIEKLLIKKIYADVSKESGNGRFRTAVAPRTDFEGSETSHSDILPLCYILCC